ncbi:MAG: VCBS repeat-containing protein [Planctomycetota bacterium]
MTTASINNLSPVYSRLVHLALACLCCVLFSCSTNAPEKPPASAEVAAPESTTTTAKADSHEGSSTKATDKELLEVLPRLPGLSERSFDKVVSSVAKREDPVVDGWDTERFSELAGSQLKVIGKLLTHPEDLDDAHVRKIASETYQGRPIRPGNLQKAFGDKSLTILRESEQQDTSSFEGIEGAKQSLKNLADQLVGLGDYRFKFKIIRVKKPENATGTTDTQAYFQISGRNEEKAVQINSTWNCSWVIQAMPGQKNPKPKLTSVDVEKYEQVTYKSSKGSMFVDCTESVFGNSDLFDRQLVQGLDYWTDRFDGAIARPAAGHGIALGDVNGDGLDDVYLCQSPGLPNLLLVQQPDGTVKDIAVEANVNWLEGTRAALLSDLDNDGDQDLVAVLGHKVVIQENTGRGIFKLRAVVSSKSSLFSINAIDFDNDRDLDLYICGYTLSGSDLNDIFANPMPFHDAENGAPNVMLENLGEWNFKDVTEQLGLNDKNTRFSYASAWDDFDGDGDLDCYVANDFGRNNLFINEGGKFRNIAEDVGVEDIGPGMSACWGDYNNDGKPDLYVSNMFSSAGNRITTQLQFKRGIDEEQKKIFQRHARGNSLFENAGDGKFNDCSVDLGVTLGRWAWGSLFVDLNNDGWEDIYVTNGFITADNNNDL